MKRKKATAISVWWVTLTKDGGEFTILAEESRRSPINTLAGPFASLDEAVNYIDGYMSAIIDNIPVE